MTEDISPALIINTSRLLNTVVAGLPSVALVCKIFSLLTDEEVRKGIYGFKIDKIIDMRKDKKFKYDLKFFKTHGHRAAVYNQDEGTGSSMPISIGSHGAAKTSTVLTISIANDLDQKAFNEDYCKKELEERMDTDIAKEQDVP